MRYTHTIDFELNCNIAYIFSYCDYYIYSLEDIRDEMHMYLGTEDGFEVVMSLGGWVFPNDKHYSSPTRYVSLYVENLNSFTPEAMLESIDKNHIYFASIFCEYEDSRFCTEDPVCNADNKELAKFIKSEFKKKVVELFL